MYTHTYLKAGSTNKDFVTKQLTGFPGKPKNNTFLSDFFNVANVVGLPEIYVYIYIYIYINTYIYTYIYIYLYIFMLSVYRASYLTGQNERFLRTLT
jgi:hypothetical protein